MYLPSPPFSPDRLALYPPRVPLPPRYSLYPPRSTQFPPYFRTKFMLRLAKIAFKLVINGHFEVTWTSFYSSKQMLQLMPLSIEKVEDVSKFADAMCYMALCINKMPSSSEIIDGEFRREVYDEPASLLITRAFPPRRRLFILSLESAVGFPPLRLAIYFACCANSCISASGFFPQIVVDTSSS